MDDDFAGFIVVLVIVALALVGGFVIGEAFGTDAVAEHVCLSEGYDVGAWVDGDIVCQALTVIKGG